MKKITSINKLALFCLLFFAVNLGIKAQTNGRAPIYYVFNPDSLKGFDENAAKQGAFDVGAYGEEFKVYMYHAQRNYIDNKYKIVRKPAQESNISVPFPQTPLSITAKGNPGNPIIAVASCTNEDFEEQGLFSTVPSTVVVSSTGFINGWLSQGASNNTSSSTSNCINAYTYGNPNPIRLIAPGAAGLTDAIIGSGYKIYSVFGPTTTTYPGAVAQDPFNHYGDWFVKLNDQTAGSSVNRIVKTFSVSPANALFQFAFISVLEGSHGCCDAGGFSLKVKIASPCAAAPVTTTCPQFTAAAQTGCTSSGNSTTYLVSPVNSTWKYNKWKLNTLDLTSFIGNCVTIEVTAFDCTYTGHAGYVYFDAQCSPMDVCTNLGCYPAGTPSITVPTCGAGSTATITAPAVTGGYTWTTPGGYTIAPGSGGQTIYTGTTGDHTLTMNPPGSCSPIIRYINVVIAPAPNLQTQNAINYDCSNDSVNGISILLSSGSPSATGTPTALVSFSPAQPTGTTSVAPSAATYTGLAAGVNTITITDGVGCTATQTIFVSPQIPIPTFTFNAPAGTILGCNPPYVPITAVNTSTNPLLSSGVFSYTWTSSLSTSVTTTYNISQVATYTVSGSATYTTPSGTQTSCITTSIISVTGSTIVPATNVSPATQALTCNGSCKTFTASTPSGTANIVGNWYGPSGPIGGPTGTPMILCANSPGTYTAQFCSTISGCCTEQTVSLTSNTMIPTVTVTPTTFNGFTINCTNPKVGVDVNTNSITGPFGYTWTPLPTPPGSPTSPVTGGYTMTIPGQYEIKFVDGFSCTVTQTVNIYIDTLRPSPLSITDLPSNSYTLNCYQPNLIATAITNPLLSPSSYSWTQPSPLVTFPSNTINIGLINVTNSVTGVTYTVSAIGANGCVGKAKVQFYKDVAMPTYAPAYTPSIGITCGNPCVAMTPTTSGTPTPINFTFTSGPPTQTATTAGALMCVPGPYTMVYQNISNGCLKTGTVNVPQNVVPPAVNPSPIIYLPCGQTTTIISANTVTTSNTYSYTWEGPPGSGMSCLGGTACATPSVDAAGVYNVTIFNTQNGCSATNSVLVVAGGVNASFSPNPSEGFSPLSVTFNNTSQAGSITSGSVTTFWNYGNGITYTTTGSSASYSATGLPNGATIYQSAGTYTVTLLVTQLNGTLSCVGTATAVVKVELPSKLEVPNVFTPNGDGVNDVFMLQTTNLTEIKCTIFDRWGVKMYDVTAEKGNIEWDGKNFSKKDVPAGTYFYILTATGKDLSAYEQKGTISLYR